MGRNGADREARDISAIDAVLAKRDAVFDIVNRHSAGRPRLFGLVARREDGFGSDIDILVDAGPECSLLSIVAMEEEFGLLLGRDVDIRTLVGLHPSMRSTVLSQAIDL